MSVAFLVFLMVIVGGITRLTESGLSITEWKPVTGALPPLNETQWASEFEKYKKIPEYLEINGPAGMTLAEFKFIYFWEWVHRLLGRVIGLAFALPLAWYWFKRQIPVGYHPRLLALLALGGLQGTIGWWMVSSGLVGRTDVSHYRLAVHLCLALFILGATVWTARDLLAIDRQPGRGAERLGGFGLLALILLAIQLFWGAFTAGLNAGYAFASWPLMGNEFFPAATPMLSPWLSNLIDNPIVVQFIHRWWAFVVFGAMIMLGIRAIRSGAKRAGVILHALVTIQLLLGIATLLTGVALWVAIAHQFVAALLVIAATICAPAIGPKGAASRVGTPASGGTHG